MPKGYRERLAALPFIDLVDSERFIDLVDSSGGRAMVEEIPERFFAKLPAIALRVPLDVIKARTARSMPSSHYRAIVWLAPTISTFRESHPKTA